MEFRVAHKKTLDDRRQRVILILYGDIDSTQMDNADESFKFYLKTNTYIKWNDPWFIKKIVYAMPHKNESYYDRHTQFIEQSDEMSDSC